MTASLGLGAVATPHVLLGVEAGLWIHYSQAGWETLRQLLPCVYLYPWARRRLFVSGGIGVVAYRLGARVMPDVHGSGWGWTIGLGYDTRIPSGPVVSPTLDFSTASIPILDFGSDSFLTGWRFSVVALELRLKIR